MKTLAIVQTAAEPAANTSQFIERLLGLEEIVEQLSKAEVASNFQVAGLVEAVAGKSTTASVKAKKPVAKNSAKKKAIKK
jgi:hypothetical protein